MAELEVSKQTIGRLFQGETPASSPEFLIPDYQRQYAWGKDLCQTLWDDIFQFAIPDEGRTEFDKNSAYYLGAIVTFKNENGKREVIDGQQRLTTLMLLLRAFYAKFGHMQDEKSVATKQNIEKCLWKTNEFGKPDMNQLKIDSEVASDNDKEQFLEILRSGEAQEGYKSLYAVNYRFFQECIDDFQDKYPTYFAHLPTRIMNNCILLPIEAESRDSAMQIFSTLNNRGLQLSDSDIFKSQFYMFYDKIGKKGYFIEEWKKLEELCASIFSTKQGSPMDELFTRYMYYARAKKNIKDSTTEALRKFYGNDNFEILKSEDTFKDLCSLAKFWSDEKEEVNNQDQESDIFSDRVRKRLFVLGSAPTSAMWRYAVSVYFLKNRNKDGKLDDDKFYAFLNKITAFIWTYGVTNPGGSNLKAPVFAEMINIVNDRPVTFSAYKFDEGNVRSMFSNFSFINTRPITRSMITWWAFQNNEQELFERGANLDVEHIYATKRNDKEPLENPGNVESLGNKALLENRINIAASDYRFSDKKEYYLNGTNSQNKKKNKKKNKTRGTDNAELIALANTKDDFTEKDIEDRYKKIVDGFIAFLGENDLLK